MIHLAPLASVDGASTLRPADLTRQAEGFVTSANANLHHTVEMSKAAKAAGLEYIPGLHHKPGTADALILLPQSDAGWRQMLRLASGSPEDPDPTQLFAVIPANGFLVQHLLSGEAARAGRHARALSQRWGQRLSGGVMPGGVAVSTWGELGVAPWATNAPRYAEPTGAFASEVYASLSAGKNLTDHNRPRVRGRDRHLCSAQWFRERVENPDLALRRSQEVMEAIEFRLSAPDRPYMPHIPEAEAKLREMALAGLRLRGATSSAHMRQLEHELAVVCRLGWASYYLIVADFIRFAHESGIAVGPGRGSGAGSLIAYALRITKVDPLPFGLLFERFLNPERVSIPDFDIDFDEVRRDEVSAYISRTYSPAYVAGICTVNRMRAKMAIKDVARFFGIPFAGLNDQMKGLDDDVEISLEDLLEQRPAITDFLLSHPHGGFVLDIVPQVFDLPKALGKHAAGVIIGDRPLIEIAPLVEMNGEWLVGWDMVAADTMGLVKYDLLGLKTARIISRATEIAGLDPEVIDTPDLKDPEVIEVFSRGDTEHVFQFEGVAFRRILKRLEPTRFADLVAAVALHRPGPKEAGMDESYIRRRHREEPIVSLDPRLDAELAETYGVVVYQEQVMSVARILAGMSLGEADLLRRAMGKKKADAMEAARGRFVSGAVAKGLSEEKAEEIFNLLAKFASYGFNKSHSATYALVAFQTAWLKLNHLPAYACAVIEAQDKPEKITKALRWARTQGISLLPPDVNGPLDACSLEQGCVRLGLHLVGKVGSAILAHIRSARSIGGPFRSVTDFAQRALPDSGTFRRLAAVGAFDALGATRATAWAVATKSSSRGTHRVAPGQMTFALDCPDDPSVPEWPEAERLARELEVWGTWISGHPMDAVGVPRGHADFRWLLGHSAAGDRFRAAGFVLDLEVQIREKKAPWANFRLEGPGGLALEVRAWSDTWTEIRHRVREGAIISVALQVERIHPTANPTFLVIGSGSGEPHPVEALTLNAGGLRILFDAPLTPTEQEDLRCFELKQPGDVPLAIWAEGQLVRTLRVAAGARMPLTRLFPDARIVAAVENP